MATDWKQQFNYPKGKVQEWLDSIIHHQESLEALANDNTNGVNTSLCLGHTHKAIHVWGGVERLAYYLGATLTYDPKYIPHAGKGCVSFEYKGYKVFELWEIGKVR